MAARRYARRSKVRPPSRIDLPRPSATLAEPPSQKELLQAIVDVGASSLLLSKALLTLADGAAHLSALAEQEHASVSAMLEAIGPVAAQKMARRVSGSKKYARKVKK